MTDTRDVERLVDEAAQRIVDYLDNFGRNHCPYEYGLPTLNEEANKKMLEIVRTQLLAAIQAPQGEAVAYGLRSLRDGSFTDQIAVCGWVTFGQRLDKLKADPWIKAGIAEIVPLYAAPASLPAWNPIETAPKDEEVLVCSRTGTRSIVYGMHIHNMIAAAKQDGDDCFYVGWMPLPAAPKLYAIETEEGTK